MSVLIYTEVWTPPGTFMPVRYGQDTKAKAIRLVREHAGDYPSEYAAITAVARRLAMTRSDWRSRVTQNKVCMKPWMLQPPRRQLRRALLP